MYFPAKVIHKKRGAELLQLTSSIVNRFWNFF